MGQGWYGNRKHALLVNALTPKFVFLLRCSFAVMGTTVFHTGKDAYHEYHVPAPQGSKCTHGMPQGLSSSLKAKSSEVLFKDLN